MSAKLRITLKRSPIGLEKSQGATARLLGLRKLHQISVHDDSPSIRGMLHKIKHMVEVEPIQEEQEAQEDTNG